MEPWIKRWPGPGLKRQACAQVTGLVQVDGKDLTESVGGAIHESFFAKSGTTLQLTDGAKFSANDGGI